MFPVTFRKHQLQTFARAMITAEGRLEIQDRLSTKTTKGIYEVRIEVSLLDLYVYHNSVKGKVNSHANIPS